MLTVVLPIFNEEAALPTLLEHFQSISERLPVALQVIAVNDGSADNSPHILDEYAKAWTALKVLHHPQNRGLGEAMLTGLSAALDRSSTGGAIATLDADGTHDPELLLQMWQLLARGDAQVVIASRFQAGGQEVGVPLHRRLISRLAGEFLRWRIGVPGVRDYTCGYRLYRAETLAAVRKRYGQHFIAESGFSCMVELLLKCHDEGATVREVPMVLRYDLKQSGSKMAMLRTISRTLAVVSRHRRQTGRGG